MMVTIPLSALLLCRAEVDWPSLLRSGGLKKLKIDELKTYLR